MTIPPIPTDFGQLAQWLLMPAVLAILANLVIAAFKVPTEQQPGVKLVVYLVDGALSYLLTLIAPNIVVAIEPFWAILAGVIAAYYAPTVIAQVWLGLRLAGLRLMVGQAAFVKHPTVSQLFPNG